MPIPTILNIHIDFQICCDCVSNQIANNLCDAQLQTRVGPGLDIGYNFSFADDFYQGRFFKTFKNQSNLGKLNNYAWFTNWWPWLQNTIKTTFTNYETTVTIYYCKETNDLTSFSVYVYRFLFLFAIPSIIMIACYAWVIVELWISTKHMDHDSSQSTFVLFNFFSNLFNYIFSALIRFRSSQSFFGHIIITILVDFPKIFQSLDWE